jgi:hypothetical protein
LKATIIGSDKTPNGQRLSNRALGGAGFAPNLLKGFIMETKHTPGPWEIHGEAILGPHVGLSRKLICYVSSHREKPAPEVNTANARLIAAAPELLGALQVCADYIGDTYGAAGYATMPSAGRRALAAIAKATQ